MIVTYMVLTGMDVPYGIIYVGAPNDLVVLRPMRSNECVWIVPGTIEP